MKLFQFFSEVNKNLVFLNNKSIIFNANKLTKLSFIQLRLFDD